MRFSNEKNIFEQIIFAISGHKLLIFCIFFLIVGAGMLATFLITPKYEATMSILYTRERAEPEVSASERNFESAPIVISDEEFNSELELIRSSEVLTQVVKELELTKNNAPTNDSRINRLRNELKTKVYGWLGKEEPKPTENSFSLERTVNRVAGNLSIVPVKKSRVIKVTYTDTDPLRAKKTLESIYQKYFDLRFRLNEKGKEKEKMQAGEVFNDLSSNFNQKLKNSASSLKKFDVENELSGTEINVQKELLLKQLYDTQSQLNATQTEIVETGQRIIDLKEKIQSQPEQIQTGSVSKYVMALDKMKEELLQLEQQKTQLLQKYQPKSRPVLENEERIQKLKKTIAEETANPPQEKTYAINDLRRKLQTDLFNVQTNHVALKEREKKLAPLVNKLRDQITVLNSKSLERDDLEREKKVNEEAYLLYQKKARETEINQTLSKEKRVNFNLVEPPRTDGEAKNPKPLLNLLVLIFLGTSFGLASAILIEKVNPRNLENDLILSPLEIEEKLNLPLLATISVIEKPSPPKLKSLRKSLLSLPKISIKTRSRNEI